MVLRDSLLGTCSLRLGISETRCCYTCSRFSRMMAKEMMSSWWIYIVPQRKVLGVGTLACISCMACTFNSFPEIRWNVHLV
jgi:hypothetical protein